MNGYLKEARIILFAAVLGLSLMAGYTGFLIHGTLKSLESAAVQYKLMAKE
jgi:hypothetical protein